MSDYELLHAYETVNLQRAGGAADRRAHQRR